MKGIFYVREDEKVAKVLLNGEIRELEKVRDGEFKGEFKKLNFETGKYDITKVHAVINYIGDMAYKNELDGFQYVIRKNIGWNGLKILGHQMVEKLSDKDREKLVHITVGEIMDVLEKAYKKDPSKWTPFENACYYIKDKEIRYFEPVRRPKYKVVPTGQVRNADIDVEINDEKHHITEGTLAESTDCDDHGAMWYRFPF
jgi:hypothetical protein